MRWLTRRGLWARNASIRGINNAHGTSPDGDSTQSFPGPGPPCAARTQEAPSGPKRALYVPCIAPGISEDVRFHSPVSHVVGASRASKWATTPSAGYCALLARRATARRRPISSKAQSWYLSAVETAYMTLPLWPLAILDSTSVPSRRAKAVRHPLACKGCQGARALLNVIHTQADVPLYLAEANERLSKLGS